jgi:hypothetical protein
MESTDKLKCVCKGNWRLLVNEVGPSIGKQYESEDGKTWTFFGLVHGDDDYYYGMCSKGYTFSNMELVTMSENSRRGSKSKWTSH